MTEIGNLINDMSRVLEFQEEIIKNAPAMNEAMMKIEESMINVSNEIGIQMKYLTEEQLEKYKNTFCPQCSCKYLNITELEQNILPGKPKHICLKWNKRLIHGVFHPELIRCRECMDFKTFEQGNYWNNKRN